MLKKIFRGICLIFFLLGVCFLLELPDYKLQAEGESESDDRVWIGQVTIIRSGGASLDKDESTEFRKSFRKIKHEVKEILTIKACGKSGYLCVTGVSRSLTERYESISETQDDHELCPATKEQMKHNFLYRVMNFPPNIKKPGDKNSTETKYSRDLYMGKDPTPLKDLAMVGLWVLPDGSYILSAGGNAFTEYTYDSINEEYHACSGKTIRVETHITTGEIGQEAKFSKTTAGEGDGSSTTIMRSIQPPVGSPLSCYAQGKRNWNSISDEKILAEEKGKYKGEYSGTLTATWEFVYKTLGEYVLDCCEKSLEELEKTIQSCYNELNIPGGGCASSALLKCLRKEWKLEDGVLGVLPLVQLDPWQCIDSNCGHASLKELTEDEKTELMNCIIGALLEYESQVKECWNDFSNCVHCEDKDN